VQRALDNGLALNELSVFAFEFRFAHDNCDAILVWGIRQSRQSAEEGRLYTELRSALDVKNLEHKYCAERDRLTARPSICITSRSEYSTDSLLWKICTPLMTTVCAAQS
jgi:hypothetical protein